MKFSMHYFICYIIYLRNHDGRTIEFFKWSIFRDKSIVLLKRMNIISDWFMSSHLNAWIQVLSYTITAKLCSNFRYSLLSKIINTRVAIECYMWNDFINLMKYTIYIDLPVWHGFLETNHLLTEFHCFFTFESNN
jgi:hypothetical protein